MSVRPDPAGRQSRIVRRLLLLIGATLVVMLALRLAAVRPATPLPVLGTVPVFSLVDQQHQPVTNESLRGKVWIASFIYTTCPGPCPRIVARAAEVSRRLGRQPGLLLVSFTVDPEADTADVLAAYAATRGIDVRDWRLLTGDPEAVFALVRKGFMLALAKSDEINRELVASQGPVVHSTHLVLVDRDLRIRGYYDSTDPAALDRLVDDAGRLLRRQADDGRPA